MFEVHVLIAFMSVFFSSRKTAFLCWLDTFSIPPRYLVSCRASKAFFLSQSRHFLDTWWIDRDSHCLLDTFLTPRRSIELQYLFSCLAPSILLDTSAVEIYWGAYLNCDRDFLSHFSIFLQSVRSISTYRALFFTPTFIQRDFWHFLASNHLVWSCYPLFFMHFMILKLRF